MRSRVSTVALSDNLQSKLPRPMHLNKSIDTIISRPDPWALQIATPNCHLWNPQITRPHCSILEERPANTGNPSHAVRIGIFYTRCTADTSVINSPLANIISNTANMISSTYKVLHGPKPRFFEDFSPQISPGSLIGYAVSSKKTMTKCFSESMCWF